MKTKFYNKNLEKSQKAFIEDYCEKKIHKLEKLLSRVPESSIILEVKTEKFTTKEAYKVEFTLHTPRRKFMAHEDDHTLQEAVDLAHEKLVSQLRKTFSS